MRRFVLGWKNLGHERRLGAYIFNYADDFVICCRGGAEEASAAMRAMMTKLKLTVNETKTRVAKLPEEKFDLLGYTFGRRYSPKTGRAYLGTVPAKKRVNRVRKAISNETGRNRTLLDHQTVVKKLNQMMNGWANYFCLGSVSKAYRAVDGHACMRLRHWLGQESSSAQQQEEKASTCNLPEYSSIMIFRGIQWIWSSGLGEYIVTAKRIPHRYTTFFPRIRLRGKYFCFLKRSFYKSQGH
jgi:hypothetical protein